MGLGPENRINDAFPVAPTLLALRDETLLQAEPLRKESLEREFLARIKMRALNCAKGYAPEWYASLNAIRKNISDNKCFADTDVEIAAWLGLIHVGIALEKTALVPLPDTPPRFIVADRNIQNVWFAEKAGVVLLDTPPNLQLLDLVGGKKLFELESQYRRAVALSPNGRVLAVGESGKLKFYDVESARLLAEIQTAQSGRFDWLALNTGIYIDRNNKPAILDFLTGKQGLLSGIQEWQQAVPAGDAQFLLVNYRAASKIKVTRSHAGAEVALVDEIRLEGGNANPQASGVVANGSRFFYSNRDLYLVSAAGMQQQKVSLAPYLIRSVTATPDPDRLLMIGSGPALATSMTSSRVEIYQLSLSSKSIAPVEYEQLLSQRFVHAAPLKRLGVIADNKIALIDSLPTGESMSLEGFVSSAAEAESLRKIEQYERMQMQRQQGFEGAVGFYPAPSASPSLAMPISPANARPMPSLIALANHAQLEGIGVYQGSAPHNTSSAIRIRVKKSTRPLILSLSSYESVRWIIAADPGAQIPTILLSGYKDSQVAGTNARVIRLGSQYAYERGSNNYTQLDNELLSLTGKRLSRFQGLYEGREFEVGGS